MFHYRAGDSAKDKIPTKCCSEVSLRYADVLLATVLARGTEATLLDDRAPVDRVVGCFGVLPGCRRAVYRASPTQGDFRRVAVSASHRISTRDGSSIRSLPRCGTTRRRDGGLWKSSWRTRATA